MKKLLLGIFIALLAAAPLAAQEEPRPKQVFWPIFLNCLPGFGVGSFVEGDSTGGAILLVADLVSGGTLVYLWLSVMGGIFAEIFTLGAADTWLESETYQVLLVTSVCVFLASKVFGVVRPIWFAAEYNAALEKNKVAFNVVPRVEPAAGGREPVIGLRWNVDWAFN